MTDVAPKTVHLTPLHIGESVEIHSPGYPPYCGIVEESMPLFDVVWVRNIATGERKLLSAADHHIVRT